VEKGWGVWSLEERSSAVSSEQGKEGLQRKCENEGKSLLSGTAQEHPVARDAETGQWLGAVQKCGRRDSKSAWLAKAKNRFGRNKPCSLQVSSAAGEKEGQKRRKRNVWSRVARASSA
jgi:hypothetical protein